METPENPLAGYGQKMNEAFQAIQRAEREGAARVQSALKAQISLPSQIDRLTEQIGKLLDVTTAQKQITDELVEVAKAQKELAAAAGKEAEKLTEQTDRLVNETIKLTRFTRGVFWFTVALGLFALVQIVIMLLEYASKAH